MCVIFSECCFHCGWRFRMDVDCENFGQCNKVCLVVRDSLHWLHMNISSHLVWYIWVRLVYPMLALVVVMSSRWNRLVKVYYFSILFLISFNLFILGNLSQVDCYILTVSIWFYFFKLFLDITINDKGDVIASWLVSRLFVSYNIFMGRDPHEFDGFIRFSNDFVVWFH